MMAADIVGAENPAEIQVGPIWTPAYPPMHARVSEHLPTDADLRAHLVGGLRPFEVMEAPISTFNVHINENGECVGFEPRKVFAIVRLNAEDVEIARASDAIRGGAFAAVDKIRDVVLSNIAAESRSVYRQPNVVRVKSLAILGRHDGAAVYQDLLEDRVMFRIRMSYYLTTPGPLWEER